MRNKSDSNNSSVSTGGIGFFGVLTIVFITLKLCGVIHWSWLWVLCPIWLTFILFVVAILFGCLFLILKDKIKESKK